MHPRHLPKAVAAIILLASAAGAEATTLDIQTPSPTVGICDLVSVQLAIN